MALGRRGADEPKVIPQPESSDRPRHLTSQPTKNEEELRVCRVPTVRTSSPNRNCRTTSATRRRRLRVKFPLRYPPVDGAPQCGSFPRPELVDNLRRRGETGGPKRARGSQPKKASNRSGELKVWRREKFEAPVSRSNTMR